MKLNSHWVVGPWGGGTFSSSNTHAIFIFVVFFVCLLISIPISITLKLLQKILNDPVVLILISKEQREL